MQTRSEIIDAFLARQGWTDARRSALAGDASFRRYERVASRRGDAVLMDAPPAKEDVRPFLRVGAWLRAHGLSAPEVLAADMENGLLLLEDLGDALFGARLRAAPKEERALYLAAADVLLALYAGRSSVPYDGIAPYDTGLLLRECALFSEWFLPAALPAEEAAVRAAEYDAVWRGLMPLLPRLPDMLVLRDFHADNLLWLPERTGLARVGLLDFQDAVHGSPAYDLVSILEDARRDVSSATAEQVLTHYIARSGLPADAFRAAYAFLGAQRNCKIIGIFHRLARRDGKRQYLAFLPRVWAHLARDVEHPLLAPLKEWMDKAVPAAMRGP